MLIFNPIINDILEMDALFQVVVVVSGLIIIKLNAL